MHVGVEYLNRVSCPVEGCCQVEGHGALAYPSLAAHHGDDAGLRLVAEGWSQLRGAAMKGGKQVLSVFVCHHPEVDLDFFDAFDHLEAVSYISGDPVLERAAGGREGDANSDLRTLHVDAPDHVQRDEVAPDLRVPYVPQCLTDTGFGEPAGRLSLPGRTIHELFCCLGLDMRLLAKIVRRPGRTSAKPVDHVCEPPPAPRTGDS